MNRSELGALLDELITEGKRLAERSGTQGSDPTVEYEIEAWRIASADVLRLAVQDPSELPDAFDRIWASDGEQPEAATRAVRIARSIPFLARAKDLIRLRPQHEPSGIEREVRLLIGETFPKSPWFYIPIAALVGAFGFAVLGVIQIRDVRVDVREQAATALEQARARIDSSTAGVRSALQSLQQEATNAVIAARDSSSRMIDAQIASYVDAERTRLNEATNQRINELLQLRLPSVDERLDSIRTAMAVVQGRLDVVNRRVASVDSVGAVLDARLATLDEAVTALASPEQQTALDQLADLLGWSRGLFYYQLIGTTAVLVLLLGFGMRYAIGKVRRSG